MSKNFGVDQMSVDLWTDQMFCKGLKEGNLRGGAMVSVFPKVHIPCALLELCGALREARGANLYGFVGCRYLSYYYTWSSGEKGHLS